MLPDGIHGFVLDRNTDGNMSSHLQILHLMCSAGETLLAKHGSKRAEITEKWRNCIMRSFTMCMFHQILLRRLN
jgi:hypothetical protein